MGSWMDDDDGDSRLQNAYNRGYMGGSAGNTLDVDSTAYTSNYQKAVLLGYKDYLATQPSSSSSSTFSMPSFEMPTIPDYSAELKAQQEEAAKVAGETQVNQLYSQKFSAANAAVDKVNTQITEESSYAAVAGADYNITPEQKKERINNMFATLWSSEQESQLSSLEGQWGAGENRWTSGVVRGVADGSGGISKDTEETSAGRAVVYDEEEDEDQLLGGALPVLGSGQSVLGG